MPDFSTLDIVPLIYALVLGSLVGLERELHGRPAGLRTHALVCITSTMLIVISHKVELPEVTRIVFDPNRMGAGIVTGIGFLGAATVLRSGDHLRGLTTAACVWFVAGLGIVLGNRNYALGVVSTLFVVSVLTYFDRATVVLKPTVYRRLVVIAKREEVQPLVDEVTALLGQHGIHVIDVDAESSGGGHRELVFHVRLKNRLQGPRITELVGGLEGVNESRWKPIRTI